MAPDHHAYLACDGTAGEDPAFVALRLRLYPASSPALRYLGQCVRIRRGALRFYRANGCRLCWRFADGWADEGTPLLWRRWRAAGPLPSCLLRTLRLGDIRRRGGGGEMVRGRHAAANASFGLLFCGHGVCSLRYAWWAGAAAVCSHSAFFLFDDPCLLPLSSFFLSAGRWRKAASGRATREAGTTTSVIYADATSGGVWRAAHAAPPASLSLLLEGCCTSFITNWFSVTLHMYSCAHTCLYLPLPPLSSFCCLPAMRLHGSFFLHASTLPSPGLLFALPAAALATAELRLRWLGSGAPRLAKSRGLSLRAIA